MHTCEDCRESITMLEAQTSTGGAHWHTRCWNASVEACRAEAEVFDDSAVNDRPFAAWRKPVTAAGGADRERDGAAA